MYGLETTVDLTFLAGKELIQICFGKFQVILHFEPEATIVIESAVRLQDVPIEDPPKQAAAFADLLGSAIESADNLGNGRVSLRFSTGKQVILMDGNEDAESFTITTPTVSIVV